LIAGNRQEKAIALREKPYLIGIQRKIKEIPAPIKSHRPGRPAGWLRDQFTEYSDFSRLIPDFLLVCH
jgi:hypothetical protein